MMVLRETGRVEQRTALLASKPSPKDLNIRLGDDNWRGEQFPVFWIDPAGDAKPVLPPGMGRLPESGQAAVSPALDRLASRHPALAARYPDRLVLAPQGIQSADELIAYVRMPEGRNLAGDLSGDTQAMRVRAFGRPSETDLFLEIVEPFSGPLPIGTVIIGSLVFLIVPGIVVITAGLATTSGARDRRSQVLRQTGASGRTLVALAVLETVLLVAPSLVGVTLLWGLIAPRLERVPLVGHDVFRGDLGLPWWLLATDFVACAIVSGFVAITVTTVTATHRRLFGPMRFKPMLRGLAFTPLWVVPFGIALAAFALDGIVYGGASMALTGSGLVAAVAGVPLVLPRAVRAVGIDLGRLGSGPAAIAGHGLERDPVREAQPFFGVAALIALALAGSGIVASGRQVEAFSGPVGETQIVFVEWLDPRSHDSNRLANALDASLVVPFSENGHVHEAVEHAHEHRHTLVVGATCRRLAPYFPGTKCDTEESHELPAEAERGIAEMVAPAAHGPVTSLELAPAEEITAGSALVLDEGSLGKLEGRVRVAAMRELPAPHVYSWLSSVAHPPPFAPWVFAGIVVALTSLTVGCLVSLVDHLLGPRRNLLNQSAPFRRLMQIEAWRFGVPYCAAVAVGFFAGLAIYALMVGLDFQTPWRGAAVTLGIAVMVGIFATGSAALLGAKRARENLEREDHDPPDDRRLSPT